MTARIIARAEIQVTYRLALSTSTDARQLVGTLAYTVVQNKLMSGTLAYTAVQKFLLDKTGAKIEPV